MVGNGSVSTSKFSIIVSNGLRVSKLVTISNKLRVAKTMIETFEPPESGLARCGGDFHTLFMRAYQCPATRDYHRGRRTIHIVHGQWLRYCCAFLRSTAMGEKLTGLTSKENRQPLGTYYCTAAGILHPSSQSFFVHRCRTSRPTAMPQQSAVSCVYAVH